jgi:hypothetical protein
MTGFDLQQNFTQDPKSLLRKVRPRVVPCHTRFGKGNGMHPICALGSSSAHTVDVTSEYPKQCINKIEYNSTLLHDRQS